MADRFGDARIEELKLLAEIDRTGGVTLQPEKGPKWDMVFFLVYEGFASSFNIPWTAPSSLFSALPLESDLERHIRTCWAKSVSDVLEARVSVRLELTHKGRVRLSELRRALTTSRMREEYGILWDGRHLETDLQVAILDAGEGTPLSVGYLDMNGLKQINDSFGHDAGNLALRAYFHSVGAALADKAEAYRVGGDEVIAVLPSHGMEDAKSRLRKACLLLMKEKIGNKLPHVSLSVGLVTTADPTAKYTDLRDRADKAMYRAKGEARKATPHPSAIAEADGAISIISFDSLEK
jgi:diguanylate cyclase (GGDEF)-like protein